jgi:hypothetical protein
MRKTIILCSPTSEDMRSNFGKNRIIFFPPLGLLLVAQSLRNAEYEVLVYDGNLDIDYKRKKYLIIFQEIRMTCYLLVFI